MASPTAARRIKPPIRSHGRDHVIWDAMSHAEVTPRVTAAMTSANRCS